MRALTVVTESPKDVGLENVPVVKKSVDPELTELYVKNNIVQKMFDEMKKEQDVKYKSI